MSRAFFILCAATALAAAMPYSLQADEASAGEPASKVTLRLEVPADSMRGMVAASERAVLDAFLHSHPNVKIDPYVKLQMQGPRAEATLYMSMAGQTAPDCLYVYARSMQKYIDQDFLYPLDEYLTPEIRNDPLFQKLLPAISRDGHVYGIPASVAVHALIYRKDLFQQAGLDPDRPPATWEQLLHDAQQLTYPKRGQFGIILPGGVNAGWRFSNFIWQAGGDIVQQQPDGSWRLMLDQPAALAALNFYKQMRWGKWQRDGETLQGCMRVDATSDSMELFNEGKAAMTIVSTTGDIGRFISDPTLVGLAPLPAGPAGQATMLEGEFWGINRLIASDKARRDAAWQYIHFLTGDRAKAIRTRTYVEAGWALSVPPHWLKQFGYESELKNMPAQWLTFYNDALRIGRLEPFAPGYDQVATELMAQLDEVLYNEQADPKQVLLDINHSANTFFFRRTSPHVQQQRRYIAWASVGVIAMAGLAGVGYRLLSGWKRRGGAIVRPRDSVNHRIVMLAWLFMIPALLSILVWNYYPLIRGVALAFMDYRILGDSRWVGLDNFIEAFTQLSFWRAMAQTLVYVGISMCVGFLLPIILAMLLSEISFGNLFFRTIFYLPAVTSGLVVMFIWKLMYDGSNEGIFNQLLNWLTGSPWGRAALMTCLLAMWLALTGLVAGAISAAARSRNWHRPVGVGVRMFAVAPLIVLTLNQAVGMMTSHSLLIAGGWSTPIVVAMWAAIYMAALLTALIPQWLNPADTHHVRDFWLFTIVALIGLGLCIAQQVQPMQYPYPWLQDPRGYWAMFWVIIPGIWAGVGPGCIIYLAAIKTIPDELYEAADVDGAAPLTKAYHITFQFLKPLVIINFVGAFVGTFHNMENILVMTGGGPGYKTMTIGMDIFFNAFTHLRFGYATAEAWVLGSLLIGFTVYQLRFLKQLRFTKAS